jgi:1-deoxy-D-xylulose-5-phosphate reductoisomerase
MKKKITILGSTGSIGLTSLEIIKKDKKNFETYILSANKNYNLICKQIKEYSPKIFIVNDKKTYLKILLKFKNKKIKIFNNFKFKKKNKSDVTISAIPGIAGLEPTIEMIRQSRKMLIANKESIICGWELIKKEAKKNKTKIIPIDSEHYSIFKLIENVPKNLVSKIYLTASGGPFLDFTIKNLKKVKPKNALKHPKWNMGKKITIDSSTLMNKIFELVEAQKLFDFPQNKFDIIIHPNSLVHAILELKNGIKKFIYHDTSMKIPIANAIYDGQINIKKIYRKKSKFKFENLYFKEVDKKIFPAITLKDKVNKYPSAPIILNAANEVLVEQFLKEKIGFLDINKFIMAILKDKNYKKYAIKKPNNINQINLIDIWARSSTLKKIKFNNV